MGGMMTKMQMAGFRCGPRNPANRETRGGRKKADVEPFPLGLRRLLSVVQVDNVAWLPGLQYAANHRGKMPLTLYEG